MKQLKISGNTGQSVICVGENLEAVGRYLPSKKTVIITDENVWDLYKTRFPQGDVIRIGNGENIKTLETVQEIYRQLIALAADRSTFILGIGGGIVCDIAGFVASTYMRGVDFGFVASTLLAQVDASTGGKNGVNLDGYKNMVGVFNQPCFVICDLNMLQTLPEKEIKCGFGEIVKHAAIADPDLFAFLETHYNEALALDLTVVERLVYDCVAIKSAVVNRDERETGERRKLNFGHTFGHAVEKTIGLAHGEAVSVGMAVASAISVKKNLLSMSEHERIIRLLQNLTLPTDIGRETGIILEALQKDKKREGKDIHFILLRAIGHTVEEKISIQELTPMIHEVLEGKK